MFVNVNSKYTGAVSFQPSSKFARRVTGDRTRIIALRSAITAEAAGSRLAYRHVSDLIALVAVVNWNEIETSIRRRPVKARSSRPLDGGQRAPESVAGGTPTAPSPACTRGLRARATLVTAC